MNRQLLRTVARFGLTGEMLSESTGHAPADVRHVADSELDDLFADIAEHRLTGLFAAAVADGRMTVSDHGYERVADDHQAWCQHALRVERLICEIDELFAANDVTYRVFKGAAYARAVYPSPEQRLYVDADLVVAPRDWARAVELAKREFDAPRIGVELRPGFDAEFGKDATLVRRGVEADIHRTLAAGPFGLRLPLDALFRGDHTFQLGGRDIPTLEPVDMFVHACLNATIGDRPIRYVALRDIAQLWPTVTGGTAAVQRRAKHWRCTAPVAFAIRTAWDTLALTPNELSHWAATERGTAMERFYMRSYHTAARSYTRPLVAFCAIPGVAAKARYARAIIAPQHSYMEWRGWSWSSHVRRALSHFRRKNAP